MTIREAKIRYRTVEQFESERCDTPKKACDYLIGAFDEYPEQEQLYVIGLDRKNAPKFRTRVTLGTVCNSLAHPREVFKPLILASCSAFILAHNHPSGDTSPSAADIRVTRQINGSSKIVGIDFLDHLIIGENGTFYSFQESGLIR